jgi:hypothetical protein
VSDSSVDEDIARTRIEVEEILVELSVSIGRNETDVGNTADVLACAEFRGMVEQQRIEKSYERRALPSSSLI